MEPAATRTARRACAIAGVVVLVFSHAASADIRPGSQDPPVKRVLGHECVGTPTATSGLYRHCGQFPASLPVAFRLKTTAIPSPVTSSEFLTAARAGLAAWKSPLGISAFADGGTTTAPWPLLRGQLQSDGLNVIGWGDPAICDAPGALAVACSWVQTSSPHRILETDIILSTEHPSWRQAAGNDIVLGEATGAAGHASQPWQDVQSTVAHELGHALGLDDIGHPSNAWPFALSDTGMHVQTMYRWMYRGSTNKRSLDVGDLQGLQHVIDNT